MHGRTEKGVRIRRGKVDSLPLYEITESELESLVRGSPGSTYLNFAVFSFSVAISFLIALLTSSISSDRVYAVFVLLVIVGLAAGVLFTILWRGCRRDSEAAVRTIKERMPP